jgi:hypothetical protein
VVGGHGVLWGRKVGWEAGVSECEYLTLMFLSK